MFYLCLVFSIRRLRVDVLSDYLSIGNLIHLLNPIVSLATLIGIVIALLQLQVTIRNRKVDLAATRFDHTIEAYRFYQDDVAQNLDDTMVRYKSVLSSEDYSTFEDERIGRTLVLSAMRSSDFGTCFRKLNVLESYIFYDEVNKYQLYSSIGDQVYDFMQLQEFQLIQEYHLKNSAMNNYAHLLSDVYDYVKERRKTYEKPIES